MNVTPDVIQRLRRLFSLPPKKAESTSEDGEIDRNEQDDHGKNFENQNHGASGDCSSVVSDGRGRLSPVTNGMNHKMASPGTTETKGDGEMKMDFDAFHQILREVIIKRTLVMETRLMADVERLKKQVSELETQKKKLQCDSERLQRTLDEICSKRQLKPEMTCCATQVDDDLQLKPEMTCCATQVDDDLLQERPMSPEISKPIKSTSFSEKSMSLSPIQQPEILNDPFKARVESEQVVAETTDINLETSKAVTTRILETIVPLNRSEKGTEENVPIVSKNTSKTSNDVVVEVPMCPSQEQRLTAEKSLIRDNQNRHCNGQLNVAGETPPNPKVYTHPPESGVHVARASQLQEPANFHQQSPRAEMPQHTNTTSGAPPLKPIIKQVSSINPIITGQHQRYSSRPQQRKLSASSQLMSSQPLQHPPQIVQLLRASTPGSVRPPQPHPSANQSTVDNHRFSAALSRGPPNVSVFRPPKRRRVENQQTSKSLQMHVVSSNSNYVMHNFKVQKNHSHLDARSRRNVRASERPLPTTQVVYTSSPSNPSNPSNQLSMTSSGHIPSRGKPSTYPEQYRTSSRLPARRSQGHLVERVFYPSNISQPSRSEQQNSQRIIQTDVHHDRSAIANDHTSERDGPLNVIQEYQVTGSRAVLPQPNALASSAVPTNPVCPPVQSPGISSTASPSGYRPGDSSATVVPRSVPNHSDNSVSRADNVQSQLNTLPKPMASIVVIQDGIVLSWNLRLDDSTTAIDNYELFACQDGAESTTPPIMWKKIGIVKALPLPMACTLTQFSAGNKYHFAVRAVDDQERAGPFSDPCTISLTT